MNLVPYDATQPLVPGITLLEASAGTGKTYNIADLLVRFVAEIGVGIESILVVTYTKAATAELRDRIRRRLGQALEVLERARDDHDWSPGDRVFARLVTDGRASGSLGQRIERVVAALEGFDEAAISTIHGFCQRMLRQNAFESGAEFDAELVTDCGPLLEEIVDDFLVGELHDAEPEWVAYLREQAKIHRSDLLALARLVEAEPDLVLIPEPAAEQGHDPLTAWRQALAELRGEWDRSGSDAVQALIGGFKQKRFIRSGYNSKRPFTDAEHLGAWLRGDPGLSASFPAKGVLYFSQERISEKASDPGDPVTHPVFAAVDRLISIGQQAGTAFKHRFAVLARAELVRRKQERFLQSYNDLLRMLRDGLIEPSSQRALQLAIRSRFRVALIDEFQDTDPVQWRIFEQVFAAPDLPGDVWLYLIGDPKQAIYGFRGADIYTYLRAGRAAGQRRFTLETNWRSDRRLVLGLNHLLGVDRVFGDEHIRYVHVGTPDSHHHDRLRFASGPRPPLELVMLPREGQSLTHGRLPKAWGSTDLPDHVASDVVALLNGGASIEVDGHERPLAPGDVAVLVRKSRQARAIQAALSAVGVPSVISGAGSVWESDEASALQRLLDGALRPSSESAARGALSTTLLGRTAQEIASLDEPASEAWVERLREWQALWSGRGFLAMFRQMLSDEQIAQRLLSRPDGERRLTNLLHLSELLHRQAHTGALRPTALAEWLRSQRLEGADDADAAELRLESDADAVRIVTIHKSKGLQYPVVLCPYLWDGRLLSPAFGEDRHLRFHDPTNDHLLTLDLTLSNNVAPKCDNVPIAELERQAENLRLLYVALTRAEHRCVVYWGAFAGSETSPLSSVLHARDCAPGEDPRLVAARSASLTDEELLAELNDIALGSAAAGEQPSIQVTVAQPPRREAWAAPSRDSVAPIARVFDRQQLDSWWRRGSFSAMTRGRHTPHEGSPEAEGRELAPDPALEAAALSRTPVPTDAPDVPLADFLRGTDAGSFLHRVLELHDFRRSNDPASLDALVQQQLPLHGLQLDGERRARLVSGLGLALQTPLGSALGGARLADLAPGDRLDELAFDLPVAGGLEPQGDAAVTPRALARVFRDHRPPDASLPSSWLDRVEGLSFMPLRGFLTGSIDLVFRARVGDRVQWFLADYKSNWLGDPSTRDRSRSTAQHYALDGLGRAMSEHHYYLQYHLYAVALHRYLGWRLGDAWDYDRDFGGALYLFLRGMVGPETPLGANGEPCGVFHDKPPLELVQALSDLFATGGAA